MDSLSDKKEAIFIVPYLNVNTTSAERFKSFIRAFEEKAEIELKIFVIDYQIEKSYFFGLDNTFFDIPLKTPITFLKVKLNFIQRFAFNALNKGNNNLWKVAQFLHLILFKTDIFHPIENPIAEKINHKDGYVISSGGHFSYFTIAKNIAKKLNYKLVIDYRDPWTFGYKSIDGFRSIDLLKKIINRRREINLIKKAFIITTVSNSLKNQFPKKFHHKIKLIPNGSNFKETEVNDSVDTDCLNILYAGTIYNEQLFKSNNFFIAFKKFITNKNHEKIKLQFIGSEKNKTLSKKINEYNLQKFTLITPRVSRNVLLNYLNNASIFLHLKYGDRKDVISSKQTEYLMFRRPILLPVSDEGDIKESIEENNAGYICNDIEEITTVLEDFWAKFNKKESLYIQQSSTFLNSISREKIAKDFVNIILEL